MKEGGKKRWMEKRLIRGCGGKKVNIEEVDERRWMKRGG